MKPKNPKDLQRIYPEAKTAAERLEAEAAYGESVKQKWLPKHPSLKITLFGTSLFFFVLALTTLLPTLWSGGLPGIAASFLAVIFIIMVGYAGFSYTSQVFYRLDKPLGIFGLAYAVLGGPLLSGAAYGWFGGPMNGLRIIVISMAFGAILLIATRLFLRKQS